MRYFDHDTGAASDDGIMALRIEHGGAAVDCYWALLEKMYRDEGPLDLTETNAETKSVCHRLCVGYAELEKYVGTMLEYGLLEGEIGNLYSARAMMNITAYQQKAETARQNGKLGGRKPKRKPSGNQGGSDVGSDAETKAETRKEKKRKFIGLYENKPINAAGGGADAGAAPHAAAEKEKCPKCGSGMLRHGAVHNTLGETLYQCPDCFEEVFK